MLHQMKNRSNKLFSDSDFYFILTKVKQHHDNFLWTINDDAMCIKFFSSSKPLIAFGQCTQLPSCVTVCYPKENMLESCFKFAVTLKPTYVFLIFIWCNIVFPPKMENEKKKPYSKSITNFKVFSWVSSCAFQNFKW